MLQMTQIYEIWFRYVVNGLSILEEDLLYWKWLKNLTNG